MQDILVALLCELFRIESTVVVFLTKFALDLFQCIALLQSLGFVLGLSLCCVSENAAFMSSNALFW